jgi:hypothetical protein
MAKLEALSLEQLYERKMTASVEAAIMLKEDFSKPVPNWCGKVCRLNCRNPPRSMFASEQVDILIIQDYKAFDEPKFRKRGADIELKHREVIAQLAKTAFRAKEGFPELTYSVTNLLKCQLTQDDIKKGKAPTDVVLNKCKPYLLQEIQTRKPKVIVSLSTAVTKGLGLKKTNYGNRGEIDGNVVITLHPRTLLMLRQNSSGKFWGPDFYEIIQRDFRKAAALARGELRNPDLPGAIAKYKKQIYIARSKADVVNFCDELTNAGLDGSILSYDTETNTLDPFAPDAKILTMQFGFRHDDGTIHAFVFPMWHRDNKWVSGDETFEHIRPILENENIKKVGHHMKFDVLMTATTTGCRIRGVAYDTMLLLHAKDSGTQGNLGLKQAIWDYLPETELGGYEDLLPKLHTEKQIEKMEGEDDGDREEANGAD